MMKRIIIILILIYCSLGVLAALEVDKEELSEGLSQRVEFYNYQGPHSKIETRDQILGIGKFLGQEHTGFAGEKSYHGKYRIIHAVDRTILELLDADILVLENSAEVDHINNVRLILTGYLMEAYKYYLADAMLLAEFITYYNAVFRGDLDYFSLKYKGIVLQHLSRENAGISPRYTEWPGRSRLLIPLSEKAQEGGLGTLVTDELTDERVIEDLRSQEGMGLVPRKEITELKEREVEEAIERIEEDRERIVQQEREIEEERQEIATAREEIQQRREEMRTSGGSMEEQAELAVQEKELLQREEELEQREEALEEREEVIAEEKTILEEEQQKQEERQERILQEREQIARDERTVIERTPAPKEQPTATAITPPTETIKDKVYFLHIADIAGEPLGQLLLLDSRSGEVLGTSSVNTIRNRSFQLLEDAVVVLAGRTEMGRAVRLVLLNPATLNIIQEGETDIFKDSVIVAKGVNIFAVVKQDSAWYVGLFDKDLSLVAISVIPVDPYTSFTFSGDWLYVQNPQGDVVRLSQSGLQP